MITFKYINVYLLTNEYIQLTDNMTLNKFKKENKLQVTSSTFIGALFGKSFNLILPNNIFVVNYNTK